jgi:undecaprenyl-diphosphatase
MRSSLHWFDTYFTGRIQAWPRQLRPMMKLASFLGYPYITLGVVAIGFLIVGWVLSDIRYGYAGGIIFATHGVGSFLKLITGRQRPATYLPKRWHLKTYSFPSGHALGSATAYGTLALILGAYGLFGVTCSLLLVGLIILIGLSRIYLGAHYPSDVVAGWVLGCTGVALATVIIQS